jgi:hypothetical protein
MRRSSHYRSVELRDLISTFLAFCVVFNVTVFLLATPPPPKQAKGDAGTVAAESVTETHELQFAPENPNPSGPNWSDWEIIQGNETAGLDISFLLGKFAYDQGAHQISVRYRNRYDITFKGQVRLAFIDQYGREMQVNDDINVAPGIYSDVGDFYIASQLTVVGVVDAGQAFLNEKAGSGAESANAGISVGRGIKFPTDWSSWQPIPKGFGLYMRQRSASSAGATDYEFRNDVNFAQTLLLHYNSTYGEEMTDSLLISENAITAFPGIPTPTLSVDSAH